VIDYAAGVHISKSSDQRVKKKWLIASIITNLGLLGYFKYCNFFLETINAALSAIGFSAPLPHFNIILPVGISFYTFQSMSYTIDLYRGRAEPVKNFIHFACYISMFPQLIAGPIVRFRDIAAQLQERTIGAEKIKRGAVFFIIGLGKKVLIADTVAIIANAWWGIEGIGVLAAWGALFAYSLQIYFDFSGYSDMACGLGYFLGFDFPQNFNSPYKAHSITDFWRRWHMSLSGWLRDFLYVSLGGNRKGYLRTYVNLFITMFLGGLWHGASWTFIAWGCYHGFLLAIERLWKDRGYRIFIPLVFQTMITYVLVLLGWVLFRSTSFSEAIVMYRALFGVNGMGVIAQLSCPVPPFVYVFLYIMMWITFTQKNIWEIRFHYSIKFALALNGILVLAVFVILVNFHSPFLYFQF